MIDKNSIHKFLSNNVSENAPTGILLIGDVHGKIDAYWDILQKYKNGCSIQVGDFGFKNQHEWFLKYIDFAKHKINFGNHDDYSFLRKPHSLKNFSILPNGLMTVRGAYSIDKIYRTENLDWWANEEMNDKEIQEAIQVYKFNKPKTMITHDCPHQIRKQFFEIHDKSKTSNGLQIMFEHHQPELWVFGHHHQSINEVINGTRFICLAELETLLIEH